MELFDLVRDYITDQEEAMKKLITTPLACPSHLRGDVGFKEMGEVYELESLLKIGSEV